jgi:thioredoxin-like negative regulator of GroEL
MSKNITIALFYDPGCYTCQLFYPVWKKINEKFNGKFKFMPLNADKHKSVKLLAKHLNINNVPTILVVGDNIKQVYHGPITEKNVIEYVEYIDREY